MEFVLKNYTKNLVKTDFLTIMLKSLFFFLFKAKKIIMNYSKIQRIISAILLIFFVFTFVINVQIYPFIKKAQASSWDFYNLVSILVDNEIYKDIEPEVERYAEDIQWVLKNTRAVIVPVPKTATPFQIASLNEWLYFDWYKSLKKDVDFNSKLIWTVLIWNLPVPVVISEDNKSTISIAPYVDFEDKKFIYNHDVKAYLENPDSQDNFKPEIWHWVIYPNAKTKQDNIKKIKDFLDKDHDFYKWENLFKKSEFVLNWNIKEEIDDNYKTFVFYYDQFREEKSVHYPAYKGYLAYLKNKEDINYNRFSKDLADKVKEDVLWAQNKELDELIKNINDDKLNDILKNENWLNLDNVPAISTRFVTQNSIKRFIEIFNKGSLSDFRTNVHNAGRYNEKNSIVNVDLIPYLVSVLDEVSDKAILDLNKQLENKIDSIVKEWLSRNIAIPIKLIEPSYKTYTWTWYVYSWTCKRVYTNYLYWINAENINSAKDCSFYRWSNYNSWVLVKASRGLNIRLSNWDIEKLRSQGTSCLSNKWNSIDPINFRWFWWWYSPLNLDIESTKTGELKLNTTNYKQSIVPLFDIVWAKKVGTKNSYSPLDCFDNNLLLDENREWILNYDWYWLWYECAYKYKLWNKDIWKTFWTNWTCKHDNTVNKANFSYRFEDYYKKYPPKKLEEIKNCWETINEHIKNWNLYTIKRYETKESLNGIINSCIKWDLIDSVIFKIIPSYIEHKSPTADELYKQISSNVTPDLPIDKIRYIDFISAKWNYKKINYPNFFSFKIDTKEELSLEKVKEEFIKKLNDYSKNLNDLVKSENPKDLTGVDESLYDILKIREYVDKEIDLNEFLDEQWSKEIKIWNQIKNITYKDVVIFANFWNNLDNISLKYKFIIENYLSDQVWGNTYNFLLPKNKSEYEIAYLWAAWDAKNMYIKLNPEEKKLENPYSNIIKLNNLLDSNIYWLWILPLTNQIDTPWNADWKFKCAPPDGVPLWEWVPAIMCRLQNMLPPKIGISEGDCWIWILWEDGILENEILDKEKAWFENSLNELKNSQCYWDLNKNGINDCLEKKLNWAALDFYSDADRYYYRKTWKLNVVIRDKNKKRVYIDNSTIIYFAIDKIIDKENNKVVFDSTKQKFKRELYKDYINFAEFWIKTRYWKAIYNFSTWNKDSDIYFKTYLKLKDNKTWEEEVLLSSNLLKIEVRWDRMFLTSSNKVDEEFQTWWDFAVANDRTNIYLFNNNIKSSSDYSDKIDSWSLLFWLSNIDKNWNKLKFEFPLSIKIYDNKDNLLFETEIKEFNSLVKLTFIKKSWEYKIVIKDSKWFKTQKNFFVKPALPEKLDLKLWTNILERSWAISTNYITIYDRFDNPVIWELYNISLELKGDSIVFLVNNKDKINCSTIEWFRVFRLKSTDKDWLTNLKAYVKLNSGKNLETKATLKVFDNVNIKTNIEKSLEVWYKKSIINLKLVDSKGKKLPLDSRVYIIVDKKYWNTTKPYFDIKNWEANIEFITSKLAGKDILFKFQIEWFKKIFTQRFTILPLKPLKVQILPTKTKLEASKDSYTTLNIELRDVYGNVVFTDNTTSLDLEILDEYKKILKSNISTKKVKSWKASFKVYATDNPWKAYIKISTSPSLYNNTFEIKGQSSFLKENLDSIYWMRNNGVLTDLGKKFFYEYDEDNYRFKFNTKESLKSFNDFKNLDKTTQIELLKLFDNNNIYKINWVWENVIALETFYFWNASKIKNKKYNALYSVLLWAPYWDITKNDYLASWMLFDKNNRSLAVTTLISSPYNYKDILTLNNNWKIDISLQSTDLTQNIDFNLEWWEENTYISLFNSNLWIDIWKIVFNFSQETDFNICEWLNKCKISDEKSSIFWVNKYWKYKYELIDNKLVLFDKYNNKLFEIDREWKINLFSNLEISLSKIYSPYLIFDVKLAWETISYLWFNFVNSKIKVTRESLIFNWLLKTSKNSIIIKLNSDNYWVRKIYSKDNQEKIAIYYKDPFEKKNSLNSFAKGSFYNFENFINKDWIWWKDWNKTLLSFAAWKNVGDAVKDYQSLLVINLWDPVIYLKKKKIKKPKIDWYKKFDRTIWKKLNKFDIEWYKVFDYNNDWKQDLLFIKNDKYLSLLENQNISWNFIDLKNLVRIEDIWDLKLVEVWDFTWDWYDDIFFVNNKWKPFLLNNNLKDFVRYDLTKEFNLEWKITIVRVFDMDNDWVDDIVTLDDSWSIYIFYWNSTDHKKPRFTKKEVYSWYWIKLSSNPRNDYGLVYFDWVPQLDLEKSNLEAISSAEEFYSKLNENTDALNINNISEKNLINEWLLNSLMFVSVPYWTWSNNIDLWDIDLWSWSLNFETNNTKQTTFIRSQYSNLLWVEVEKIYKDRNWWKLKSWDIVNVKVTIKNNTSHNINNLVYIEDFYTLFDLVPNSINNSQNLSWNIPQDFWKILIEWIKLKPNEVFELTYNLKTKLFKFWYIEVWLFEKWEIWDDLYWDIIFKNNEQNCSQTVDIFRSIDKRSYEKWIKQPECDENKLKLPEQLDNPDDDWNWIPDYIDDLLKAKQDNNIDLLKDYANSKLNDTLEDSDNDWLPDNEDLNPDFWESNDLMSWLDRLNEDIDKISEWIDKIMEWLGCWFWWGSCLSLPMNWAPLAPWNDPTLFGFPIWDGLMVWEGLPIFSSLTWLSWPFCVPIATVWPVSPFMFPTWTCWWILGAGWRLWTISPTNIFRLYYTPTLTWWQWIAACFWGPALAAWLSNPPWVNPIVPWGNCIVAAAPIWACNKEDEDLGDPTSMGTVFYFDNWFWVAWNWFWVINWNCTWGNNSWKILPETNKIDTSLASEYLNYKNTWIASKKLIDSFSKAFLQPNTNGGLSNTNWWLPPWLNWEPLLSMDWENDWLWAIDVSLDLNSLWNWNFQDVEKIKKTRISAFPDFLMDWVTRQIEEIVTKLTDFPTLYITLPDFSSIYDSNWMDYISNWTQKAYEEWKQKQKKYDEKLDKKIENLKIAKEWKDCKWKDAWYCLSIDTQIRQLNLKKWFWFSKQNAWISQVYEFLSNVPIINVTPEDVVINIPWLDNYTLDKTINDYKNTLTQWKQEAYRFTSDVSFWKICSWTPEEKKSCEEQKAINKKVNWNLNKTISSLEQNIAILEEWKKIPDKVYTLVNKKNERLDQVLCNLEVISELMGWWIWRNGERFKAWVETYILVKAILKSWQLLADLFIDFDAECHECKNERNDLLYFELKLISFIIPKIPVIKFPKWPDIILDLHNIRLNIDLTIPNFKINQRPIVLPVLPQLKLSGVPNLGINTPVLPVLPTFEIPELPDLPTLPKIELPDLPPPPKLPKLFASLEAVINILKLVAKALCILKKSPFVPEWRAWDQIAFLTERTWYLPMDFLDVNLPQFSYPFVDAIKVTTWVNFEQDTEFLTEMTRNIVGPINTITNNVVHLFKFEPDNFDFSEMTPSDMNINVKWEETYKNSLINLALVSSIAINNLVYKLDKEKNLKISNKDFIHKVNISLNKKKYIDDPRFNELRKTWNQLEQITYSKQDEIIKEALKNNIDKFETLKNILKTEKFKNKNLLKNIKKINDKSFKEISKNINSDFYAYNKLLEKYNLKFVNSTKKLLTYNFEDKKELKNMGEELMYKIKGWLKKYNNWNSKLLVADNINTSTKNIKANTCQQKNNNSLKYKYKWIYIVEDWWAYKLFDYIDNLTWKEKITPIDVDNDWDKDLLYLVDNELFLKENLSKNDLSDYLDLEPLKVNIKDNKFFSWNFIESINWFDEVWVSNDIINFNFLSSTNDNINNYRLEFYNRIDKFLRLGDFNYIPSNFKKSVIDMFSDTDNLWLLKTSTWYNIYKDIAYIDYVWIVPWVKMITNKLVDVTEKLRNNILVTLASNTKLYSWNNNIKIFYIENEIKKNIKLPKYSNISFKNNIAIYKISWWKAYIDTWFKEILKGQDIAKYMKKPLILWTEIIVDNDRSLTSASHIDINYYDWSNLGLDLRKINYYKIYDLWIKSKSYLFSLSYPNDYYYSKIYAFSWELKWTDSKQVLLSPQLAADNFAPSLNYNSIIKIPIYQEKIIDFSDYIYENSWIDNITLKIKKLNPPNYEILRSPWKIKVKFGKFDNLFKTKIEIILKDKNWNTVSKSIDFEVYSPKPIISSYNDDSINWYINENLTDEPINIYRVRWGIIEKLKTKNGKTKVNTINWKFKFNINSTNKLNSQNLVLKDSKQNLLSIDWRKSIINFNKLWLDTYVKIEKGYPIVYVKNNIWEDIYRQKITLKLVDKINIVSSFDNIEKDKYWIYLKILDNKYSYYINPMDIKLNPWILFIYRKADTHKTPLFIIFRDWRLKILNNYYKIEYSEHNWNVVYNLIDKHYNKIVGELLFNINNNYIIK